MSILISRHLSGVAAGTLVGLLASTAANSAAIERVVPQSTRILFQDGSYLEFGVTWIDPDQSGDGATLPQRLTGAPVDLPFFGNTGDLFVGHWNFSGSFKADINDKLSYAIIFDQPFGADTKYGDKVMTGAPGSPVPGFSYDGTKADLTTNRITGVLAYDINDNIKVWGGLIAEQLYADAAIPFVANYSVDAGSNWGWGYMGGAAYHLDDIALRVALTYSSAVKHDLSTKENSDIYGKANTDTDVEMPQSAALEFQTGVAEDTLIFGSIRWVDWSEFSIAPPQYVSIIGRPLVNYDEDWWTYTAGVGRRFNDTLSGTLSLTYEPSVGGEQTTLGPYDGRTTVNAGLSYDINDRINLSGGVSYGKLGDTFNILKTDFNDGSVFAAGMRVGYSF